MFHKQRFDILEMKRKMEQKTKMICPLSYIDENEICILFKTEKERATCPRIGVKL